MNIANFNLSEDKDVARSFIKDRLKKSTARENPLSKDLNSYSEQIAWSSLIDKSASNNNLDKKSPSTDNANSPTDVSTAFGLNQQA